MVSGTDDEKNRRDVVSNSFLFANFFFSAKKKLVGFAPVNQLLGRLAATYTLVGENFLIKGNTS